MKDTDRTTRNAQTGDSEEGDCAIDSVIPKPVAVLTDGCRLFFVFCGNLYGAIA